MFAQAFVPPFVQHMKEHMVLWYMATTTDLAEHYTGLDIDKAIKQHEGDEDFKALDNLLTQAATVVGEEAQQLFGPLIPLLQQAQQQAQQLTPPPPMDPAVAQSQATQAMVQIEGQKAQQQGQSDQMKASTEQAKLQQAAQADAMKQQAQAQKDAQTAAQQQAKTEQQAEADQAKVDQQTQATGVAAASDAANRQSEERRTQTETDAKLTMNEADNQTAVGIAQMEMESGERVALSTGTGINPGRKAAPRKPAATRKGPSE
jgi:hypothetical protein